MSSNEDAERLASLIDEETIKKVLAYRKVVSTFIRESFALAVETGSEVLAIMSYKGAVSSWASPKFDPLVSDEGGRKVIAALLKEQLKEPQIIPPSEDQAEQAAADAAWADSLNFIEEAPARLASFQTRLSKVLSLTRDVPEQYPGAEACALIASLGGKIFSLASPAFKPLIESKAGRGMIMAMLGDPDAQKTLVENLQDLHHRQREQFEKVTAAAVELAQQQEAAQAAEYSAMASAALAAESSSPSSSSSSSSSSLPSSSSSPSPSSS